ncbi:MAG TPA: DUF433 domain-containing protein [Saprospiraceae bacterium]|nr:DUF433 domain-containing protein [Saprospiraceae bacterium]
MINWKEHIVSDPQIMYGKPVVKGTRVPVEMILEKLSLGESTEEILLAYPHITREAILACIAYALDSVKNEIIYANAR